MRSPKTRRIAAVLVLALLGTAEPLCAAELEIFATRSVSTILAEIGTDFERETGHRLAVTTDIAIRMVRRIEGGARFDVLVAAPEHIDALVAAGKIVADTRTDLVRSGIGVLVRRGAPKPDIGSVDAFKRALLTAKSIAFLKEGQSGVYLAGMLERLGIAEALAPTVRRPETDTVSVLVAAGEVELGMVVITQILTTPGVDFVGPLPAELQRYITFTAGISADSKAPDAARALLAFLKGPAALPVIRAQGMEPGGR
jgi:molybdate transport system substrate-binding protein